MLLPLKTQLQAQTDYHLVIYVMAHPRVAPAMLPPTRGAFLCHLEDCGSHSLQVMLLIEM